MRFRELKIYGLEVTQTVRHRPQIHKQTITKSPMSHASPFLLNQLEKKKKKPPSCFSPSRGVGTLSLVKVAENWKRRDSLENFVF